MWTLAIFGGSGIDNQRIKCAIFFPPHCSGRSLRVANRSFLANSDDLLRCAETVARCMHEGRIGDIRNMQESHKKV